MGVTFNVPVVTASKLLAADGVTLHTAEDFVSTISDSSITGTLTIQDSVPLILGPSANNELNVSSTLFQISSNTANQNFQITTLKGSTTYSALYINGSSNQTGIFTSSPQATLDVNGTFRISSSAPATSTSPGVAGQIAWDSTHFYVCVATNSWVRTTLATW